MTGDATRALDAERISAYRLIVDNYPDGGLVVFDSDLRYVVAGGLGMTSYGLSKEKLEGKTIWEALPADACAVAEPHYRAALQGESSTFYLELNGQTLLLKVTPIRDGAQVVGGLICSRNATGERATAAALAEAQERFQTAFENAPIGMAIVAPLDMRWLSVNPAFCAITGYSEAELRRATFATLTHPDDWEWGQAQVNAAVAAGRSYHLEKRYLHARGHVVWVAVSGSLLRDPSGEPLYYLTQVQDISDRKHREEELRWQAERDSLTGLWNRHRFDQELARCRNLAERHAVTSAVILLDLDNLKVLNDTYGHGGGDEALRLVADVLMEEVRITDVAARYGGDEFAVALPHTGRQVAVQLAERLTAAVAERQIVVDGHPVWVSVSAGVADNTDGVNPVAAADHALYDAKRNRRASAQVVAAPHTGPDVPSGTSPDAAPEWPFEQVHGDQAVISAP